MTSQRSASTPAGLSAANTRTPQPGTALLLGVLLVLLLSGLALWFLPDRSLYLLAPIQVLLGSTIFIALIALVVLVFARLGLYDRGAALGLPDGSVRALIALILLIIFIIFANVIFGQLSDDKVTRVASFSGLNDAEVANLPGSVDTRRQVPATATQPASWEGTYVVLEPSPDAAALGAQVVTGLLTLVAAISAFYFGTGSVTAGAAAVRQARGPGDGGLRLLRPSRPVGLTPREGGGYEALEIELDGAALGSAGITASILSNDDQGSIRRGTADNQFVYTAGANATEPVTLRFTSNDDSRTSVDLVVSVPPSVDATTSVEGAMDGADSVAGTSTAGTGVVGADLDTDDGPTPALDEGADVTADDSAEDTSARDDPDDPDAPDDPDGLRG